MTWQLWIAVVLAFVLLVAVVAVEETRVHEAQREARSWASRVCHHGGSLYDPSDPSDDILRRGSRWS